MANSNTGCGYMPMRSVPATATVTTTAMAGVIAAGEPAVSPFIHMKTTTRR